MKPTKFQIAQQVSHIGAVIVISQAVSFARWNQWAPTSHFVNFHATLLAVVGVVMLCSALVTRSLTARIEKLERVIASSVDKSQADDSLTS
jgi:hypothetical protein